MRHLSPEILVTLAESPEVPADPHLGCCERCRTVVGELRATLTAARQDIVPEPSPLFWDRFSARVADAVAEDEQRRSRPWSAVLQPSRLLRAVCLVLPILTLAVVFGTRFWRPRTTAPAPPVASEQISGSDVPEPEETADASWALVTGLAEDLDWEAAADSGLGPAPGSAQEAVVQLSSAERSELARLIESELHGPSM